MIAQKIIRGKNFFINKINNKFFSNWFSRFFLTMDNLYNYDDIENIYIFNDDSINSSTDLERTKWLVGCKVLLLDEYYNEL